MPFNADRNQTPDIDNTPRFELSLRQMIASTGAAVTAAILGSRLGVAGTLIGAALASIVTMCAAAIYSHSLAKAQYKVRQKLTTGQAGLPAAADAPTVVLPPAARAWGQWTESGPWAPAAAVAPSVTAVSRAPRPRRQWLWAGVGALATCVIALGAITGFEAIRGTPISGGAQGGLTVLGGAAAGAPDTGPTDAPTRSTTHSTTTTSTSDPASTNPTTSAPSATSPGTSTGPSTVPPATVTATVTKTVLPPAASAPTPSSQTGPAASATVPLTSSPSPTTTAVVRPGGQ